MLTTRCCCCCCCLTVLVAVCLFLWFLCFVASFFCLRLGRCKANVLRAASASDKAAWLQALRETQVFAVRLEASKTLVPRVVDLCCEFVDNYGILTEGIYRKSGNASVIKALRRQFDADDTAVRLTV